MKKLGLLSRLFICFVLLVGCKKDPPVALFSVDKASFIVDEDITFTNQSENATSYVWDFGDGKSSTDESPIHAFSTAGTFTVNLTVTNKGGDNSLEKAIQVLPSLTGFWYKTLTFTYDPNGISGTMNITHHEDNTLTGGFVFGDGTGTVPLLPTSLINVNAVTIEWEFYSYKYSFHGTVNSAFNSMSGTFSSEGIALGTWSAKKL